MQLLYAREHLECYNYSHESGKSLVTFSLQKGASRKANSENDTIIIFASEGDLEVTFGTYQKEILQEQFVLIPPNTSFTLTSSSNVKVFLFYFHSQTKLCKCFSLDMLSAYCKGIEDTFHKLTFNERIKDYLDNLELYLKDGMRCYNFLMLKKEELFFILRAYYSKKELASFFYPVIGTDICFREFVLTNYLKINSTKEFAELANYSISGFEKKFFREFGDYPHQWIMVEKSKKILHDICYTSDSLKNICLDYNFSSPGHFSRFCRKFYGRSPSEIRKEYKSKLRTA